MQHLHRLAALYRGAGHALALLLLVVAGMFAFSCASVAAWFVPALFLLLAIAVALWMLRLVKDVDRLVDASRRLLHGTAPADPPRVRTRMLKPLAAALEDAAARIRSQLDSQRLMGDAMAHELRTPLARLQFTCALLVEQGGSASGDALLADLHADIAYLDHLVSAGMDYARFGRTPRAERSQVPLKALVDTVWKQLHPGTGQRFHAQIAAALHAHADAQALELALRNVLKNAQQHASSCITIHATRDDGWLLIHIDDDGAGIPSSMFGRVFEPYVRLDTSSSGFGLGLAIVKTVVQQHGGDAVMATSPLGGARVSLRLPAGPAECGRDVPH